MDTIEVINRYDRQERIPSWNQDKLRNAKIAIFGSSYLSNFLSASLAALGIGKIRVYDDEKVDEKFKQGKLEKIASSINPLINFLRINNGSESLLPCFLDNPNMIIFATNKSRVLSSYKSLIEKMPLYSTIPVYVVRSNKDSAFFSRHVSKHNYQTREEQEPITSEVITGFLVGEIVKNLMFNSSLDFLKYSFNEERFSLKDKKVERKIKLERLDDKKIFLVGAGALANFFGIGLTYANVGKIYIADNDKIEPTNLNRQILFYERVGTPKADVLAERLNEINSDIYIEPIKERINENSESLISSIKPDLIAECVDNLATRAILNHLAIRYGIPLVSGGTNYEKGQVVVYEPGKSLCLNCRLNIDEAASKGLKARSCMDDPEPSVVTTNHIIGSLMAAETRCVLDKENYSKPIRQRIRYDSTSPLRVGLIGTNESCSCTRNKSAVEWIQELLEEK